MPQIKEIPESSERNQTQTNPQQSYEDWGIYSILNSLEGFYRAHLSGTYSNAGGGEGTFAESLPPVSDYLQERGCGLSHTGGFPVTGSPIPP